MRILRVSLLSMCLLCASFAQSSTFPPSGGVGVGALNVVSAIVAGPGTSVVIDATATPALSTLNLTSSNIGSAILDCFTGTGATKTAVGISSYTYTAATPIATLTVTLASSVSNAYCTVNSNGGAGAAGANGSNGADGATWSQASGVPSDGSGNNGDFYFRTATSDVYQKASGTWGSPIANIKGAAGAAGAAGNTVLTTSGAPSSGTGANGDFAYDPTAKIMYGPKAAGSWPGGVSLAGGGGGFAYKGVLSGLPGTCSQGDQAFITDAIPGRNKYDCSSTNVYVQSSPPDLPGSGTSIVTDPTTGVQTVSTLWPAAPFTTNPQTSTYQVLSSDFTNYKKIPAASGTFTITLVASGSQPPAGQYITIENYGSGVVTIARSGQNINGATTSLSLPAAADAQHPSTAKITSNGTDYFGEVTVFPPTCTNQFLRSATACAAIAAADLASALITPVKMAASTFDAQTDGATITWAIASVKDAFASVTLGGNRTLAITNPVIGGNYVFKITQDGTGTRTLAPGSGCTWKVLGGTGGGTFALSTAAGSIDVLAFTYDGTNCLATVGKAYAAP